MFILEFWCLKKMLFFRYSWRSAGFTRFWRGTLIDRPSSPRVSFVRREQKAFLCSWNATISHRSTGFILWVKTAQKVAIGVHTYYTRLSHTSSGKKFIHFTTSPIRLVYSHCDSIVSNFLSSIKPTLATFFSLSLSYLEIDRWEYIMRWSSMF